jgi:hypothetical protein
LPDGRRTRKIVPSFDREIGLTGQAQRNGASGAVPGSLKLNQGGSRVTLQQNTDRIQTTHFGSLPRPHEVLDL